MDSRNDAEFVIRDRNPMGFNRISNTPQMIDDCCGSVLSIFIWYVTTPLKLRDYRN